jgi:hypothetical protein
MPTSASLSPLADLLLARCVNNRELANFFHWFVEVETHAHGVGDLYSLVLHAFHTKLSVRLFARGSLARRMGGVLSGGAGGGSLWAIGVARLCASDRPHECRAANGLTASLAE